MTHIARKAIVGKALVGQVIADLAHGSQRICVGPHTERHLSSFAADDGNDRQWLDAEVFGIELVVVVDYDVGNADGVDVLAVC